MLGIFSKHERKQNKNTRKIASNNEISTKQKQILNHYAERSSTSSQITASTPGNGVDGMIAAVVRLWTKSILEDNGAFCVNKAVTKFDH